MVTYLANVPCDKFSQGTTTFILVIKMRVNLQTKKKYRIRIKKTKIFSCILWCKDHWDSLKIQWTFKEPWHWKASKYFSQPEGKAKWKAVNCPQEWFSLYIKTFLILGISEERREIYLKRQDYYFCNTFSSRNTAYGLARLPALAMFPDCPCPIL